jgi:hypothetical protein
MFTATITEFEDWLRTSKHGDSFTYATAPFVAGNGVPNEVSAIAGFAQRKYQDGEVNLVQRRITKSPGSFDYIAQRRKAD